VFFSFRLFQHVSSTRQISYRSFTPQPAPMALPPNPDKTADEVEAVGCQVWCQRLVLQSIDNVATREQRWTRHVTLRPRPGLFLLT